ncbi:MAG: hypothetical protein ACP5JJ_09810 [Anaerolineae bacterium]
MHIHRIDPGNLRDVGRFVAFPFHLYRGHPQWVPPFVHEARAELDPRRHPFYQHSEAAFFLALSEGSVLGRLAVLDNRRYNQLHGERTAWFYRFDAVDDPAVSRALFDAGFDWARGRGLDRLWGPKGLAHTDGQGLLIEGFEHRPAIGIPYNYPYYATLLEDVGFEKKLDFLSWYMDRQLNFPERFLEVAERVRQRRGYRSLVYATKDEVRAVIPQVTTVYNDAFKGVQGFVPLSQAEAEAIGDRILSIADPKLISLLMRGDELIGFVLAYPDISAALQRCRGRLWPLGWFHLLREFRRTRWININGMGILEKHRGLGGNALLYAELYRILIGHPQYDFADLVQIQETNQRIFQEMEAIGVKAWKTHRMFQRSLA